MSDVVPLRPSTAALCWATPDAIFVEIPTASGIPYVARYPRTVPGLAEALGIICKVPAPSMDREVREAQASHPIIKRPPPVNLAMRETTRGVLKKLGMI